MTKFLFIPHPMPSHCIPLVALAKQLFPAGECAFLLPRMYHEAVRSLGMNVLDIDRRPEENLMPEIAACSTFSPDILIDDLSFTTSYISRLMDIPRISIVRKGIIPREETTKDYRHSSGVEKHLRLLDEMNLEEMGLWKPENRADLFVGNLNIIPSIPSVEPLPQGLDGGTYEYSGPLLLSDNEMLRCVRNLMDVRFVTEHAVDDFVERNKERKLVYFTMGLACPEEIRRRSFSCIRILLDSGTAILTNVCDFEAANDNETGRLLQGEFFPSHKVCSSVDLMVHQCGSGTYGYQLHYQLPAIILGTRCYDRDDVAKRLDELGAACYMPDELDQDQHRSQFNLLTELLLDDSTTELQRQRSVLARLKVEIHDVQAKFSMARMIDRITSSYRSV